MKAYVPGKTITGAVKLSSNENPLGPSPMAVKAVREALDGVHRYPDGAATELKTALGRIWETGNENILVANGSDEVFALLAAAWIGPGENAVSARETFSQYRYAVTLYGGEMRETPLNQGYFNLDAIMGSIDENTRMVFICNPNNPTGTYLSHDEIDRFLSRTPENLIVILDEAYAEFADKTDFPDSKALLKKHPHLVVTRTFSKLYGLAGLRVGYALGDSRIINGAERASMPFNVNNLAQAAALAALEDTKHRKATLELVQSEKSFFYQELDKQNIFYYPTQANFICFRLHTHLADLWTPIAERGIALRDLKSFGLPFMARYTFGSRENNLRLLEILDEVNPR